MHADLYGPGHTIVRLANPYGKRQSPTCRHGGVAVFLDRVLRGEPLDIFGDGSTVRDFIYIKDATRAMRLLLDSGATRQRAFSASTRLNEPCAGSPSAVGLARTWDWQRSQADGKIE
jgi:UDP-glucose 4-epimerase